jgi:predicted amidohydrolase YtcJ
MAKNMSTKRWKKGFLFATSALSCALFLFACSSDSASEPLEPADMVLTGADVYTLNPEMPWATAVSITGGWISHVGDERSVEPYVGAETTVVEMNGRLVLPGFIDTHAHPLLSAGLSYALVVDPSLGPEELVEAVRSYAAANPEAGLVLGFGFNATQFGPTGPRKELLDEAVSDRPAMLIDEGSHSAWVNSKLIEVLGIGPDTPDPVPGVDFYQRDENGIPTGWFVEPQTFYPALAELDAFDAAEAGNPSSLVYRLLVGGGVTTVFDAGAFAFEEQALGIAREMDRQGTLPFRLVASHMITDPRQVGGAVEGFLELRRRFDGDRLRVGMIKILNDGTTQALTAAYLQPYETVDSRGAVLLEPAVLQGLVLEADRAHIDLHIHAIGDRAVRDALDAIEVARRDDPNRGTRHTIAHLELIDDTDLPRFAELDVIAQTTPAWHSFNGLEVLELLGRARFEKLYRFRELVDAGVRVTFGSDFPASGIMGAWPVFNMGIGATRQLPGEPMQGGPEQRLSIEELIRGYTIDAAYQLRMEGEIGSVEEGKRADLVVLQENIFELPPEALSAPLVQATILDGAVVAGALPN